MKLLVTLLCSLAPLAFADERGVAPAAVSGPGGGVPEVPAREPAAPAGPAAPAIPAVVKVDGTRFRIGEVEFDSKTRTIRFPAAINMRDGLLEYAIVHENGKVHESLLHTRVNPSHLNVAFKLLRYQASAELFPLPEEDGTPSDRFPEVDEKTRAAARVAVRVIWKQDGKDKSVSLQEWIAHAVTEQAMPAGPWVYGGSVVFDGRFEAESSGDIVAIFTSRGALLNYPGKDHDNDEVWTPMAKRVPPEGTRVTVEFSPWKP